MDSRYAIELIDVEKKFAKKRGENVNALAGISLHVGRGEVVGILGPNGSGKSTLVRVISTLVIPDGGKVRVFGLDALRDPRAAQRMMNRVSVEASFFKKLSAYENLIYGSKLYGVTSGEAKPQIGTILEGDRVRPEARDRADGAPLARHAAKDRAWPARS